MEMEMQMQLRNCRSRVGIVYNKRQFKKDQSAVMGAELSIEQRVKREVALLRRQDRGLTREIARMEREKQVLVLKLKRFASEGRMELVQSISVQYIASKQNIGHLYKIQGQMANVTQRVQIMKSTEEINRAILGLTSTMKFINQTMGSANVMQMISQFESEVSRQEMLGETLDDMLSGQVDEVEQRELVNSVLDEIGVTLGSQLREAPNGQVGMIQNDLEQRFSRLT
jgi:hypothetical protein